MFKLKTLAAGMLMGASLATHAAEPYKMAYLTSWGLSDPAALEKSKINTYMLSFGEWDSQGNIATSDGIASVQEYNAYYMSPGYITWTNMKLNNPSKKMMISFGGQKYESMWSYISTPQQREAVAKNLAALLTQDFPVYAKNLTPSQTVGECLNLADSWNGVCNYSIYQKAGTVQLDGIDFDFEKAARLTDQEGDNLLDLAARVKALVPSNKLLSLTTYHVGADPVECADNKVVDNCSFIETDRSSHNGEVIKLLEDSKNVFNFFNAMTYDAGTNFKYQVAMQNYAKHVGSKAKILVGTSNNPQWAPVRNFTESQANNVARAKWASENGYGGFFIWALGANENQMSMPDQVSTTNAMIDAMGNGQVNTETPTNPTTPTTPTTPTNPTTPNTPQPPAAPVRADISNLKFVNGVEVTADDMAAQFQLAKKITASIKPGAWTPQITLPAGVPEGSAFTFIRAPYVTTKIITTEYGADMPLDSNSRTYTYLNGKWTADGITLDTQDQLTRIDGQPDGLSNFVNNIPTTWVRVRQGVWAKNINLPAKAAEGAAVRIFRDSSSGWATNVIVNGVTFALPISTDISFTYTGGSWKNPVLKMHYNTVIRRSAQALKDDLSGAQKINALFQIYQ